MFKRLFLLEWRSFFRSADLGKGIAVKLLLGFLGLYFLVSFLTLGISLHFLLKELKPDDEPIYMVNKFLLLWFCLSFFIRVMFQKLPLLNIKPLLIQNIDRSTIVKYTLFKTVYSFCNFLLLVTIVPYVIITSRVTDFSNIQLLGWAIAVIGFEYAINFLNLYLQKNFSSGFKKVIPFVVVALLLFCLDYFGYFSITDLFGSFFTLVLTYPVLFLIPVALAFLTYFMLFKDLQRNMFLDAYLQEERSEFKAYDLAWTNRFGGLAPFLQLDLKLLWRSKRARNTVIVCLLFLAYGLIFYTNPELRDSSMLVFVGIFITGIFVINFGQFVPSWDSAYYSMLMTQNMPLKQYLESKAILMYISIGILAVLSTAYLYFGLDILWINISCAIYNMGVNVPLILYFGSMNKKRIDLDNGNFFNYQGTGAAQWLVSFPLILIPIIIWVLVKSFFGLHAANIVLIVLGIIGLALRNEIITMIANKYRDNKYKMLAGFKEVNN